jgi:SOS-response transcriptional repressor LexA
MLIDKDINTSMYRSQYVSVFDSNNTKMYPQAMTKLRENLDREMKRRGWDDYRMQAESGVPQPTTNRFLNGKIDEPRGGTVRKWAAALRLSEGELRGLDDHHRLATGQGEKAGVDMAAITASLSRGRAPLISWASAGEWRSALQNHDGVAMIRSTVPVGNNTFALPVEGDSMTPEFNEGEMIIIEPDLTPEHKDYVLVKTGEDVAFRQLWKESGEWLLKPLNERYLIKLQGGSQIIGVIREKIKIKTYK